jgi:purine-binding chemotaxis protein CheW
LSFRLGEEEYAIDILKVQEIRGYDSVTRIAGAPEFIKGVTNLRGVIVPIVDLRLKFGLGQAVYDAFTVVIILNLGSRVVGVVVDAVCDVLTLGPESLRPAPEIVSVMKTEHLRGLGVLEDRMLILLDIEKLLLDPELALVEGEPVRV